MKYTEQRMLTLNEHCVICDERHVFQNGPMLKVQAFESGDNCLYILLLLLMFLLLFFSFALFCLSQPAVCSRELCVYSFHTLGVMSEATDVIATGAEVCSAYVSMICCEPHGEFVMIKSKWHICY